MDGNLGLSLDADAARNFPPEVSAAIGRFAQGADDDRDREVLQAYIDSGRADPRAVDALRQMVSAMGSGGNQPPPRTTFINAPLSDQSGQHTFRPGPQATNVLPTNQISSPPNLPAPIQGSGTHYPGISNTFTERVNTYNPPPDMTWNAPSLTPSPVSPMPTGGYGASNIQARAARQAARGDARGSVNGGARGGTDWRGIEGMGPNSAFNQLDPNYVTMVAKSPDLAAAMMTDQGLPAGRHAPNAAAAMTPMMGSAMAMAQEGMLGGVKGHGLGVGRPLGRDTLQRAEGLLNSLGPGESIDPAYVYSKGLRMARKTPLDELSDPGTQIQVTQDAILKPLQGLVDEGAYTATQNMLQRAAMTWLQGVADGSINPDLISYPEYLRQQKKQHYLGR
jgi:hypothetical protein